MSLLDLIGACVCFLAVIALAATPIYFAWKSGDLFSDKKKK